MPDKMGRRDTEQAAGHTPPDGSDATELPTVAHAGALHMLDTVDALIRRTFTRERTRHMKHQYCVITGTWLVRMPPARTPGSLCLSIEDAVGVLLAENDALSLPGSHVTFEPAGKISKHEPWGGE